MKLFLSIVFLLLDLCFFMSLSAQSTIIDTISIITFNDFHGAFAKDRNIPGVGVFVQTILDEKQKHSNTIVVSAGDNFSGSYFSRKTRGNPLPELFKTIGLEVSAIGNHEFDWGLSFLKDSAAIYTDFVAANIVDINNITPKWVKPYKIVERKLKNGVIFRIAFVGLTTTGTPLKSNLGINSKLKFIHPLGAASIQTLYELKKEEPVDMIVLLTHIGTNMKIPSCFTEENAKILPYMDKISAIISGHSHNVVLKEINNVPIIQAGVNGSHIGKLLFQVCKNNGEINVSFIRGDTIRVAGKSNKEIENIVDKYIAENDFGQKLTSANDNMIHDRAINELLYTSVGAYVTASYSDCFENLNEDTVLKKLPVIGVNHFGGIRVGFYAGDITKLQAGNVLPFGGYVVAYNLNGKQLKKLLNEDLKTRSGRLQTSFLELEKHLDTVVSITYIKDGQKKIINNSAQCVVVTDIFLAAGGDGYDASIFLGHEIESFNIKRYETTNAFIDYLRKQKTISNSLAPIPIIKDF